MVKALKIIGIIALTLVIIVLLVYFLVLCYPKLNEIRVPKVKKEPLSVYQENSHRYKEISQHKGQTD